MMRQNNTITTADVEQMITHWLNTPVGTYLGSDYGFDRSALLFQPLNSTAADEAIEKLKRDIPILTLLDGNSISLYAYPISSDQINIILTVGNSTFSV